jgi:hypothetical protein
MAHYPTRCEQSEAQIGARKQAVRVARLLDKVAKQRLFSTRRGAMNIWSTLSRPFAVVTTVGAIGAIAWTQGGCGGPDTRYYCDDTGCYTCDGFGCTTVAPPAPQSCSGDLSCPAGDICTDKGCASQCQADADCPKGTVCDAGGHVCRAPGTTPGNTKQCTTTKDCGAGAACEGGKCQACGGTNGPCPCASTADCATPGDVCSAGYCTAASNTCKYSSECGSGKVCADGQCTGDCGANPSACQSGQICVKGACEADPSVKPQCQNDTQCSGATPKCVAGACTAQCTTDSQCPGGDYCNQGACVVDKRPKPVCASAAECGANQQCLQGYCKYTCKSDGECKLIDARIGYCGKDNVCRTLQEAQAQCTQSSECSGGKSCVANQCL